MAFGTVNWDLLLRVPLKLRSSIARLTLATSWTALLPQDGAEIVPAQAGWALLYPPPTAHKLLLDALGAAKHC